jgi:hypothetical protein
MITFHNSTPEEVDYVLDRLWDRGKREAEKFGVVGDAQIRQWLKDFPPSILYTLICDDVPLAITGSNQEGETHYTYFLATKQFKDNGLAITRFMNRFTKDRVETLGIKRLELWSASDHDAADRWFNILGFHFFENDPPFRKYLYSPEK